MKVLPLVLVLLVVISLSVQQDLSSYKIEKVGRINHLNRLLETRENLWEEKVDGPKKSPPPPPPSFSRSREGSSIDQ